MQHIALQAFHLSRKGLYLLIGLSLVLSLVSSINPARAAELTAFSITLGDSKPLTAGNIRYIFTTATSIVGNTTDNDIDMKIVLRFPFDATDPFAIASGLVNADVTIAGLPTGGAIVTADGVAETNEGGSAAADTITIDIDLTDGMSAATLASGTTVTVDLINDKITTPAKLTPIGTTAPFQLSVSTTNGGGTVQDTGSSRVAIQDAQSVSASVNTVLTFTVAGVNNGSNCIGNGPTRTNNTGVNSTATTLPFGTLEPLARHQTCQTLSIATNAPSGYSLYITQNTNLVSGSDDIDQYKDGARTDESVASVWTAPAVSAQNENTHGHFGYTTSDIDVFSSDNNFAGVPAGPTSSQAPNTNGLACNNTAATVGDTCIVEFDVEISALQPAGSYTSELQYIVVPIY